MSNIALTPNASGTGVFTIASPNSNTNRTLTLPDATGTVNVSGLANEVPAGSAAAPAIYSTGDTNTGIFFPAADTIAFAEGGDEAMRINSSGNLLVGKTENNDTSVGCVILPTDANTGRFKATGDNGTAGASFQVTNTSGSSTFIVRPNGNVVNTNNSYGSISDIKLKENIVDATPKLDKLNQVRVVNYNLIGDQKKQIGVVAQELEQIFPSMIEESPDEDGDGNRLTSTTKAVKYSVFVPMLIKALQEQQALITALEARITALEAAQ